MVRVGVLDRWLAERVQRLVEPVAVRLELWDGSSPFATGRSSVGDLVVRDRRTLLGLAVNPEMWFRRDLRGRAARHPRRGRARGRGLGEAVRSSRDVAHPCACLSHCAQYPARRPPQRLPQYRDAGLTLQEITAFRTGVIGASLLETRYPRVVSYAIRRCEFDTFLLRRAGARVLEDTPVERLRWSGATWIANDAIGAPVLVGAGGHFCRSRDTCAAAETPRHLWWPKKRSFAWTATSDRPPSPPSCTSAGTWKARWCVPKGDYLNVGIGRRDRGDFGGHVRQFIAWLERRGALSAGADLKWRGHAYLASGAGSRPLVASGALTLGDAAGLAYPESGEGIRPAIESGRLAAQTLIDARGRHSVDDLQPYAAALGRLHPRVSATPAPLRAASAAIGRVLLGSPAFTRHVVLDRWFLRA